MKKLDQPKKFNKTAAIILRALNHRPRGVVYETGTVPTKTVEKRRAKNRVARKSRRANRG